MYCCVRTASNSCFYDLLCDIYGYLSASQDPEDLERPLIEIEKMLQSSAQTEQTMRGEGNQIVSININNGSGSFLMRDEANEEQGHHKKSQNNSIITVPKLELSILSKPL